MTRVITKTLETILPALCLGLALTSGSAYGEEVPDYILQSIKAKTENPEELNYRLYVKDRCPIDIAEPRRIAKERIAARSIEAVQETLADDRIHLLLAVDCILNEGEPTVYRIGAMFGWVQQEQGALPAPALIGWPFGSFGSGDEADILEVFEDSVEKAVRAYRAANEGS